MCCIVALWVSYRCVHLEGIEAPVFEYTCRVSIIWSAFLIFCPFTYELMPINTRADWCPLYHFLCYQFNGQGQLLQEEEVFQTMQEWVWFSQGCQRKTHKHTHTQKPSTSWVNLKIRMKVLLLYPSLRKIWPRKAKNWKGKTGSEMYKSRLLCVTFKSKNWKFCFLLL